MSNFNLNELGLFHGLAILALDFSDV